MFLFRRSHPGRLRDARADRKSPLSLNPPGFINIPLGRFITLPGWEGASNNDYAGDMRDWIIEFHLLVGLVGVRKRIRGGVGNGGRPGCNGDILQICFRGPLSTPICKMHSTMHFIEDGFGMDSGHRTIDLLSVKIKIQKTRFLNRLGVSDDGLDILEPFRNKK